MDSLSNECFLVTQIGSPKYSILSQNSIHRKDNKPQIIMLTCWTSDVVHSQDQVCRHDLPLWYFCGNQLNYLWVMFQPVSKVLVQKMLIRILMAITFFPYTCHYFIASKYVFSMSCCTCFYNIFE